MIALRNAFLCFVTLIVGFSCVRSAPLDDAHVAVTRDTARVRRELEKRYDENIRAFLAKDLAAIMALRTEDFHAERRTALSAAVRKWKNARVAS